MGVSFSSCLFGIHTLIETKPGLMIFYKGTTESLDPIEGKKCTGRDKLWKRWHASGLLAMAHVGYLGMIKPEYQLSACTICGTFHTMGTVAMLLAYQDGTVSLKDALPLNVHLYCAGMFAAISFGLLA